METPIPSEAAREFGKDAALLHHPGMTHVDVGDTGGDDESVVDSRRRAALTNGSLPTVSGSRARRPRDSIRAASSRERP